MVRSAPSRGRLQFCSVKAGLRGRLHESSLMQNLGFDEEEDVGMVLKYLPTDCLSDAKKKERKKETNT